MPVHDMHDRKCIIFTKASKVYILSNLLSISCTCNYIVYCDVTLNILVSQIVSKINLRKNISLMSMLQE